ncbi:hypothetical protein [Salisediminibacterium halotolerans]|uniref:Uncharacterized membrane protein YagU, involved in acid resistance, DUF1440 family n=1 Tax=Salisediminibacterium halotolerans TaxID=517425 RepID=A0A1H9RCH4_9BACI|nr:hypothetical protein [Salisediminibacterium haloalkalitolerans]SER70394.1 Uncharacterized membrane protein YagU, involved in acid resistance, DUF1440 family [Salisediminibacterium haloalkalitolerans]
MAQKWYAGLAGGFLGGLVFGIYMQAAGMLESVAMLVGSDNPGVGWGIHLIISLLFGLAFAAGSQYVKNKIVYAVTFGVAIWIIGPLLIMPLMLGMGQLLTAAFAPAQLMSLVTHLVFAGITAVTFHYLNSPKLRVIKRDRGGSSAA